jgi:hypothetical protein
MAICDWCGIREAFLVAMAREQKKRRPRLLLCHKCWDVKWSGDDYDAQALPPPPGVVTLHQPYVQVPHTVARPFVNPS